MSHIRENSEKRNEKHTKMPLVRYRKTQEETLEDYISRCIEECRCRQCSHYQECLECFGDDVMETIEMGKSCNEWDSSMENLQKEYERIYL